MERKYLAVFRGEEDFLSAEKILKERFKTESYSPGADRKDRKSARFIGVVALICGIIGAATGFGFQYYASAIYYPLNLSGKGFFDPIAAVPVAFETTILFSACGAFAAFLFSIKKGRTGKSSFNFEDVAGKHAILISGDADLTLITSLLNGLDYEIINEGDEK